MTIRRFRLDWVLIDELAIGPAPVRSHHVDLLEQSGIKGVLSLCSDSEIKLHPGLSQGFMHKRQVLPDHKDGRPPDIEELTKALRALAELMPAGPVFVHCVAAMERSPLICTAWLVQKCGLDIDSALQYMMQAHPGTNPLPSQLALLKNLSDNKS